MMKIISPRLTKKTTALSSSKQLNPTAAASAAAASTTTTTIRRFSTNLLGVLLAAATTTTTSTAAAAAATAISLLCFLPSTSSLAIDPSIYSSSLHSKSRSSPSVSSASRLAATPPTTTTTKIDTTSQQQKQHQQQQQHTTTMKDLDLETLASHANSYASANGIMVVSKEKQGTAAGTTGTTGKFECAPMSLLPNAYPRDRFQQAHDVAPYFNELVDRVSRDDTFLKDVLGGGVSTMDPFTAKLLQLYQQVYVDSPNDSPANSADRLGIHRSDYMLHKSEGNGEEYQLKQVELNTIAASFAGLSCKISMLHTYLTSRFKHNVQGFLETNEQAVSSSSSSSSSSTDQQQQQQKHQHHVHSFGVPHNPALTEIPVAINFAVNRYLDRYIPNTKNSHRIVVLFVVQPNETNTVDQRLLEFALWEHHGLPVVRMSLEDVSQNVVMSDDGSGALLIQRGGTKNDDANANNGHNVEEIAVVYYRAGYAPTDYPDGDDGVEWSARLMLEQSRATKCPSLGYHLAGTKKVQQELARPGVLERFFPNDDESYKVSAMRDCFAGLYSMGDDATPDDIDAAKSILVDGREASFVLKPQREGGGYNFYGTDLATKLRDNTTYDESTGTLTLGETLAEYILMQRLFPPQQRAILLRGGKVEGSGESVSELGCFGCLVVDAHGKVQHNQYAGFLLRTKFSGVNEGGVASGFATLSSPYLC